MLSPQLRVPEKRTIARLKGLVLGFHFVRPAARGLVVTTEYYWDLLRKNMLCKCMGLVFAMGENCFEKTGFYQKRKFRKKSEHFLCKKLFFPSFGNIFTLINAWAIQTNLGINALLNKNCAREYGLLANGIRN